MMLLQPRPVETSAEAFAGRSGKAGGAQKGSPPPWWHRQVTHHDKETAMSSLGLSQSARKALERDVAEAIQNRTGLNQQDAQDAASRMIGTIEPKPEAGDTTAGPSGSGRYKALRDHVVALSYELKQAVADAPDHVDWSGYDRHYAQQRIGEMTGEIESWLHDLYCQQARASEASNSNGEAVSDNGVGHVSDNHGGDPFYALQNEAYLLQQRITAALQFVPDELFPNDGEAREEIAHKANQIEATFAGIVCPLGELSGDYRLAWLNRQARGGAA
jgi:hypothetical protein